jgi:lipopolysaccharide transport system permease protein
MSYQASDHIKIYEPNYRVKMGFIRCYVFMIMNTVKSRELIWQLFKRDFLSGYKQSFFGMFWIFISPVIGIVSYVFMNQMGILNPGNVGVPYPVFVLTGITIWGLFMSLYSSTAGSLSSGGALILQVNFSHEVLVAQQVAQTIANFLVNILMVSLVLVLYRISPCWQSVFFPLTLVPILFIGSGIGMVVSVISVVVHDFNKLMTSALGFLMILTPIIYAPGFPNPIIQRISKWNPLAYLIGGARDIILYGRIENTTGYAYSCLLALVIFLLSWRLFFLSEHKVAEKI